MAEVIRKHELEDVYRIADGVLLTVRKYYVSKYVGSRINTGQLKKHAKKLKGISHAWQLTSDIAVFPKGSIIIGNYLVDPDMPVSDYRLQLTFSGGTFGGTYRSYQSFDYEVRKIMESYQGGE